MERRVDVVVVGGGIAGSSLAGALAAHGVPVLVLERQEEYRDRVRGETMMPWGALEMRRLGLEDVLRDAGGAFVTTIIGYDDTVDPATAEANAAPLGLFVEGVDGTFNVGHPQSCEALAQHAQRCGAAVVRGVDDVAVELGDPPVVRYTAGGVAHSVSCRLVVGADGRQSLVRKALGYDLHQVESKAALGGLLVEVADAGDANIIGTSGDVHYLVFPRPNGFARLYLGRDRDHPATAGADRVEKFLQPFRDGCFPGSERFGNGVPAGPCAYYPGTDSWTDRPLASRGAVLIGDAAGWSDPVIGQGLSVAMRDARTVRDVLVGSDDWSAAAFDAYTAERAERMRRIRFLAYWDTELRCTFTPEGRARRAAYHEAFLTQPDLFNLTVGLLSGPEVPPAETYGEELAARIAALG